MTFLIVYKDAEKTVVIEYQPNADGLIDVLSIDIQPRPHSQFELREQDRRKHPRKPRQLQFDAEAEQAEAMCPYVRLEA